MNSPVGEPLGIGPMGPGVGRVRLVARLRVDGFVEVARGRVHHERADWVPGFGGTPPEPEDEPQVLARERPDRATREPKRVFVTGLDHDGGEENDVLHGAPPSAGPEPVRGLQAVRGFIVTSTPKWARAGWGGPAKRTLTRLNGENSTPAGSAQADIGMESTLSTTATVRSCESTIDPSFVHKSANAALHGRTDPPRRRPAHQDSVAQVRRNSP